MSASRMNTTVGGTSQSVFGYRWKKNEQLNEAVISSGLPKQEHCYRRCMQRDIVVQPNFRVYNT